MTDFQTTKKAPWWEKAPDELMPFRRDFYSNVKKVQMSKEEKKEENEASDG